jgi:hypothetical protein
MTTTWIYELAGAVTNLVDAPRSYEDNLRRLVTLLREDQSTLSLSKLPDDQSIYDVTPANAPTTFLQAAGSANAMTIEVRKVDDDGEERLYTVGRGGARHGQPDVRIPFNGGANEALVYPDEVFDADEAGDIFVGYFTTGQVPSRYALREYDLAGRGT